MKTSFAVAVLLGLVTIAPQGAQAVDSQALRRHHYHRVAVPFSREYVQARDIDEMDLGNEEDFGSRAQIASREDAAEAETERMERLAQRSRREYEDEERGRRVRIGNLAEKVHRDYLEGEENLEEDDQFIQEAEIINEEEEESADEREQNSEGESSGDDSESDQSEDEQNVQVEASDDDDDDQPVQQIAQVERVPERTYFFAGDTNVTPEGKEYTRKYPEGFDEDSPNKFVHHILKEYALEEKDDKGAPTGNFFMNKKWTQVAAREVLEKHKKLNGDNLEKYMNQYFGRTWEHFDVNEKNMLDALDMPAFMKYLCSDQSLDLDNL